MLRENFPVSAELGIYALVVSLSIGVPAGVIAALNRNSIYDYLGMGVAIVGVSLPVIILGPILQYVFGLRLGLLPIAGWVQDKAILPAFALGFSNSALTARLTRASLLQILNEDYMRTAQAKGLRQRRVIGVHALRNALIPVVTILGPLAAFLVTGSFVAETIFAIPGIGRAL
jgi:ABC-type dipeptide/oligopeptide/nickel transport system permease component